jgi:uncharacterized protein involved in exopolysaccharide biosynthesis
MKKGTTNKFQAKSLNLRDAVVVAFRYKWMILLTFLTTASVATFLAFYLPEQYESRMKILVKNVRVENPVTADKTGVVTDPNDVSEGQIIAQTELLKSRDLLEQVVKTNNLAEPEVGKSVTAPDIERAVYKLEKDLKVAAIKKANIIEVSYTSKSPETAAAVLNQLSQLYLDKHIKLHRPSGTSDFFKEQTEQSKSDLRAAENKLSDFQRKMDVVSIGQQKDLGLSKFMEVQARLNDINGAIKETDKRIAEIEKQLSGTERRIFTQSRVMPNQDSVERFKTMLVELRNRRTQLLTKFQPDDRLVKEVDEQIRITNEALAKATQTTYSEQASDINPLRQALESELTKAKVEQMGRLALKTNLESQVLQYQEQLAKLKSATTTHDDLSREVKKADETYQLYAQKQEESRISDELDKQKISNVSIAEAAVVPRVPNKTNRSLTIVLGIIMGLVLGIGCAITAEFFRETIHTPNELEVLTEIPVIATVPMNSKRLRQLNFRVKTAKVEIIEPEIEEPVYVEPPPKSKKQVVYAKY